MDWESIRFQFIVSFDLQQIVWSWVPVRPCKRNTNVSLPHFCIKKRERAFSDFFINWPFEFFLDKLRANVCNFRQSVDSREFFNFFIYCPNNLYSTLISKITLKGLCQLESMRSEVMQITFNCQNSIVFNA